MCLSSFPLRVNIPFIRRISRNLQPDYGIPCFPTCCRQLALHGYELWNKDGRESVEFLPDNHGLILPHLATSTEARNRTHDLFPAAQHAR